MTPPRRYRAEAGRLYLDAEELLAGPEPELNRMALVLNLSRPRDCDLAATLRGLIAMTRDCSFAPGRRLLGDGTPMVQLRGRRHAPAG